MKTALILLIILSSFNSIGQFTDSLVFESPDLKVGASVRLPLLFTGGCICRPYYLTSHVIDSAASFLMKNDSLVVHIEAHVDTRGVAKSNLIHTRFKADHIVGEFIERGFDTTRVKPRPKGETEPWTVSLKDSERHPFLEPGTVLTEGLIYSLPEHQREICHNLNRRIVMRIVEIKN